MRAKASRPSFHVGWMGKLLALFTFIFGLVTFGRGFLLTRSEVPYVSPLQNVTPHDAVYRRVVFILVDGLAFEFIQPVSNLYPSSINGSLPFISELVRASKAHLVHFIADPPTTTLQRLKGLMTGSMPTFVDAGSNFGSSELREDNLILQWRLARKRILFVGDDTWLHLFPQSFHDTHAYDSFNVKDLDTVDSAVDSFIYSMMVNHSNDSSWDIIIGHRLGIDHCGHTYGTAHPEMRRKLGELDLFISTLVNKLNEDDLLLILGDHGMTASGDHGGDSFAELDAALIFYSRRGLPKRTHAIDRISQIDLVPTLATLSGVSIPFSNLGVCVESFFPAPTYFRDCLVKNFVQVMNYTLTYHREIGFDSMESDRLTFVKSLSYTHNLLNIADTLNNTAILSHLFWLQDVFRAHWTRFDLELVFLGILLLISAVLCFVNDRSDSSLDKGFLLAQVLLTASSSFGLPAVVRFFMLPSLCVFIIILLLYHSFGVLFFDFDRTASLSLLGLLSLSYSSNSFVVHEIYITAFLLQTVLLFDFLRTRFTPILPSLIFASVLIRLGLHIEVCREESFKTSYCRPATDVWMVKSFSKLTPTEALKVATWRLLTAFAALFAMFYMFKRYLRRLAFRTTAHRTIEALLFTCALCLCFCWLLDALVAVWSSYTKPRPDSWTSMNSLRVNLARSLLLIISITIVLLLKSSVPISPPKWPESSYSCAKHHSIKLNVTNHCADSSRTFKPMFSCDALRFDQRDFLKPVYLVWIVTTFVLLPILTLMIFLNEVYILGLLLVPLLILIRCSTLTASASLDSGLTVHHHLQSASSWSTAVYCCLVDNFSFYTTGHQPTISSIPWTAAFAAHSESHTTRFLPALMILTHVYAGPILTAMNLPLLIVSAVPDIDFQAQPFDTYETSGFDFTNPDSIRCKLICAMDLLSWRLLTCKAILTLGSVLGTAVLRRHLMVWKIFFPRLLFSSVSFLVSSCILLVVRFLFLRLIRAVVYERRYTVSHSPQIEPDQYSAL